MRCPVSGCWRRHQARRREAKDASSGSGENGETDLANEKGLSGNMRGGAVNARAVRAKLGKERS